MEIVFFVAILSKRRRKQSYTARVNFASSFFTTKIAADLQALSKNGKTYSTNVKMDYVIPRVTRNRVAFAAKLNNLSTRTLTKVKANAYV
jgi:hypothetical protein